MFNQLETAFCIDEKISYSELTNSKDEIKSLYMLILSLLHDNENMYVKESWYYMKHSYNLLKCGGFYG